MVAGAAGGFLIGRVTADKITDDETQVALPETPTSTAFNSSDQAAIDTLLQEGLSAHVAGDLDEAAAKYEQVLAADSANKFALFNRGLVAHTRGDLAAAIADYEATLAIDDAYVPARFNLGIVYSAQGEWSDAEAAFRAVVDSEPDNTTAMYRLGLALIEQGDDAGGQQLIDEATAIDPGVAD